MVAPGCLPASAAVVAIAAALAALQVASPCQDPVQALRCPDLVMGAPSHLRLDRKHDGRQFLRMENAIINVGTGPAELFARRSGPREMSAEQVITDAAVDRYVEVFSELAEAVAG